MAPVASPGAARIAGLGLLGVAAAILFVAARPLATDDLWWHLRMGEAYATGDLWPDEAPLVHTTHGRPPVPHEWLFQVAVHGVDVAAGHHGLRVLHALAVVVVLSLAFATLRRGSNDLGVAALAPSVFAALSWYRLVQCRPDLLSFPALPLRTHQLDQGNYSYMDKCLKFRRVLLPILHSQPKRRLEVYFGICL